MKERSKDAMERETEKRQTEGYGGGFTGVSWTDFGVLKN